MIKPAFLALVMAGLLSFCDTAEERAEAHFQSGVELLEQGDIDRALVELRNVFQLNGQHQEARRLYADTERARGNLQQAFGHYLRLVEQYPDDLEGQRALAEMSIEVGNWDAARRHGAAAAELDPSDTLIQSVNLAVAYRDANTANDASAMREAVTKAQAILDEDPDSMIARRVVIDDHMRNQEWTSALSAIDAALAEEPETRGLYTARLGVLAQLGENREIQAQLEDMIARFPDDETVPATLVRWYLSQGNTDAAQAFLKARAVDAPAGIDEIITYVRFLAEVRDRETALVELESILAADPPEVERLKALRAGFRFELDQRNEAIAEMESLIDGMEPSDERRRIMVMLARMLDATGNSVGARALVEEVLEQDATQTEGLKMRAGWLIESDRTDEAIVALRSALGEAPNDATALTLMAQAHERAGNRDLMAEMLSRAVEASRNAPNETLRYARYLIAESDWRTAETVLINALRLSPGNVDLLGGLGEVHLRERDWPRLTQVIASLRRLEDNNSAEALATEFTMRQLAAQDRQAELLGLLESIEKEGDEGIRAAAAIIRVRLDQGDVEGARQYATETLSANPGNPDASFLMASLLAVTGEAQAAEAAFRDLTIDAPQDQRFWLALYNIQAVQQNAVAARQTLLDGLKVMPDNLRINWALAGILERQGDMEGAIEIYDRLYAANTNNVIIANNLASLLATARTDDASLERAFEIARRLRGRDVPAFQDTYGWIAFRRGDLDTALSSLEPAAEGLPTDPRVQYHLARTYAALERDADALAQYQKVVEVVGDGVRPEFMEDVEAEVARLSAAGTTDGATDGASD
ncbi:tetratricopeptide repeat protein [Aestuariivita boseongensis]|uniref:tetratricopeptide repeat protein n=1 Tax=Aestuariivita boseongensis TaxID=1470562 RepID=UPI000682DE32|nr:tetratricopeptide repeat protein [Aestuariivita boseongensis]